MATTAVEYSEDDGYEVVLGLAGAKVLAFKAFGSYLGEWWALVEYGGARAWVNGWYGSCSGCDALQGEFGFSGKDATKENLASFGKKYLEDLLSTKEALKEASRDCEWDMTADSMVTWIKKAAAEFQLDD